MKKKRAQKDDLLDTSQLFRMPWTNSDNAFSWLEITRRCNLKCGYCYQTSDPLSDKSLPEIEKELKALLRLRKCDTLFVSGGEPLLHPDLDSIIRIVRAEGVKSVLVTNGHTLTRKKVKELKEAGLFGFIIHVDSGQSRPGWVGKSEKALNNLRQQYADMIHAEGEMICGFNTTILPETLHEVGDIVSWTVENIDKVCTNTLIPVRVPREDDPWDLYVNDRRIEYVDTAFSHNQYKNPTGTVLAAQDIYEQVRKVVPGFRGNAFLGGTEVHDAPKWLFGNIIGSTDQIFGTMGPKGMEMIQNGYHFLKGKFLSFLKPGMYGRARSLFSFAFIDREIRRTLFSYLRSLFSKPLLLFRKVYIQSLLVLQPQDVLPSGAQDLCDGCPNKTYHEGRLVSMCRKEEFLRYGGMVTMKKKATELTTC